MSRSYFRRAAPGQRLVRGDIIRRVQAELGAQGADAGTVDGVFGKGTQAALKIWQVGKGFASCGEVNDETWTALMGAAPPDLFERCLQITSDFEGTGYTHAVGNFDGALLTWGIIGFTLAHGEIGQIVAAADAQDPAAVAGAFGPLEGELRAVVAASPAEKAKWADKVSVGADQRGLLAEWKMAFERFGDRPAVRQIQVARARDKYWATARADAKRFDLKTERGLALAFDIAVQNGGISGSEGKTIAQKLAATPAPDEATRLRVIANVIAETSKPEYVEDVRSRKLTFAAGSGTVHESDYELAAWGLDGVAAAI